MLEKQANHRCSWGSISSHPFWQPNPPAAPGTLPAQPLFDSIIATLERTISKQLEDQAIHDAERIFEQKSDFKDDSGYINPNLTAFAARNLATEEKHANIKLQFLLNNYLSKNDVYTLLKKFVKINELNWWDLKKHADKVKLFIHHKISKYIKQEILNNK